MEPITIILCGVLLLALIALGIVLAMSWGKMPDSTRQAVITQLYALANLLRASLADGKIEGAELKALYTQMLAIIAAMRGVPLNEVAEEFPSVDTTPAADAEPESDAPVAAQESEPDIGYIEISTDSTLIGKYQTMYADEFSISDQLTLDGRQATIYAIVEAPANATWRAVAETTGAYASRGHKVIRKFSPGAEELAKLGSERVRRPVVFYYPAPNGWSLGDYEITFTVTNLDQTKVLDYEAIPVTVTM